MYKKLLVIFVLLFLIGNAYAETVDSNVNKLNSGWTVGTGVGWTFIDNNVEKNHTTLGYAYTGDFVLATSNNWFFEMDMTTTVVMSVNPLYASNKVSQDASARSYGFSMKNIDGTHFYIETYYFNGATNIELARSKSLTTGTYNIKFGYYDGKIQSWIDGNQMANIVATAYDMNYAFILDYVQDAGATKNDYNNIKYGYFATAGNPFTIAVTNPTTGDIVGGTTSIDFNMQDVNRTLTPQAKIYYSASAGAYTNLIYYDTNLLDANNIICDSYDFTTTQNCSYSWDVNGITDGTNYIDLNVFNTDSNKLASGGAFEIKNLSANFNNTIDIINERIALYDDSNSTGVTISDWNWIIDTVKKSDLQDYNYTTTERTDLNVCLQVGGFDDATGLIWSDDQYCETIATGKWYGDTNFYFYDEETETAISTTLDFNGTEYTGTSFWLPTNQIETGATNTQRTFTITKTGYNTRYYSIDMNRFTDLNVGFAILQDTNSLSIPLKVYKTDETTLFTNTYVELYLPAKGNLVVGRRKTSATGTTTFSLSSIDQNYYANVDNGLFTYYPIALTVLYPKNEETLAQIDENWQIDITQNLYVSYTELNAAKIIYLLPNTSNPYNIRISDMNGNYFPRNYAQIYPGNPLTDTLQPYLVSTSTGLLTTITTKNAYTNTVIGGITLKIYKFISGEGRTLVETVITDDKGQSLILLVLNGEYAFEAYQNEELLKTYSITATSSTIWLLLPIGTTTTPSTPPSGLKTTFTPVSTGLSKALTGNQAFTQTLANYAGLTYTYTSIITQNGAILSTQTGSSSLTSNTFTHSVAWADMNNGTVTSRLTIVVSGSTYVFNQAYTINDMFGTNVDLLDVLSSGLRRDATCNATGVCFPLLVVSLIASIAIAVFASMQMGNLSGQSAGIIFLIPMILFTYLTWIPFELTVGIVIILLAFLVNERRQ